MNKQDASEGQETSIKFLSNKYFSTRIEKNHSYNRTESSKIDLHTYKSIKNNRKFKKWDFSNFH